MAQLKIETSILIHSNPEKVWERLMQFDNYGQWNPFITSIKGEAKAGEVLSIEAGGMKFKPTVLASKENVELRWLGKLLFKGLFDGEHSFRIQDNHDGTVTFYHDEQFKGILVGLFRKKLEIETKAGFIQMNERLKQLVEENGEP